MSDVFLCVVRGFINVNKFEVRLLPSSHLKKKNLGIYKIYSCVSSIYIQIHCRESNRFMNFSRSVPA